MTLWIILTALTALAAAWLTIPLVRRHEARVDARAATIAVLKFRVAVEIPALFAQRPKPEAEPTLMLAWLDVCAKKWPPLPELVRLHASKPVPPVPPFDQDE